MFKLHYTGFGVGENRDKCLFLVFYVSFPEFFNDRTLKRFWTEDLRFDGGDEDAERKQVHGVLALLW